MFPDDPNELAAGWARVVRRLGWPLTIAWLGGVLVLLLPVEVLDGAWKTGYGLFWVATLLGSAWLVRRLRPPTEPPPARR